MTTHSHVLSESVQSQARRDEHGSGIDESENCYEGKMGTKNRTEFGFRFWFGSLFRFFWYTRVGTEFTFPFEFFEGELSIKIPSLLIFRVFGSGTGGTRADGSVTKFPKN